MGLDLLLFGYQHLIWASIIWLLSCLFALGMILNIIPNIYLYLILDIVLNIFDRGSHRSARTNSKWFISSRLFCRVKLFFTVLILKYVFLYLPCLLSLVLLFILPCARSIYDQLVRTWASRLVLAETRKVSISLLQRQYEAWTVGN